MRALAQRIGAMPEEQRAALAARAGIRTIEGHALSVFNCCMVLSQMPASVVGGFQQWRKAGRCVRKGEHGAAIWVPVPVGKAREGAESGDAEGEGGTRFVLGTVFDIAQTDPIDQSAAE